MFQKAQEKVIKLVGFYSKITFEAKYTSVHNKGFEKLTPKKMLQKLLIALAQAKAGNRCIYHENLWYCK